MRVEFVGGPKDGDWYEIPETWAAVFVPDARVKPLPVVTDHPPYAVHRYEVVGHLAIYRGYT